MQVAPGIHRIEAPLGERRVCVYLLEGAKRTLLVDSGLISTPREFIVPYLESIGRLSRGIDVVLTTHADFDHLGGNAELRKLFPDARFLAHSFDRRWIEDVDLLIREIYGQFGQDHGLAADPGEDQWIRANAQGVELDAEVAEGDEIQLDADWKVRILHTPGHTRGHITVFDPRSRAAIIADAALSDGLYTRANCPAFPPTYRFVVPYRETLRKLMDLAPSLLLTSHYEVIADTQVPAFLRESIAFTERMQQAVLDRLQSAAAPLSAIELSQAILSSLGDWPVSGYRFLLYPLLGHLEDLQDKGRIASSRRSGIIYYERIDGRN